jgi:membrane-bound lytic murein transglycosylase A
LLAAILVAAILVAIGAIAYTFVRAGKQPAEPHPDDAYELTGAVYELADFSDLAGWRLDGATESVPAFIRSCRRILAMPADAPLAMPQTQLSAIAGAAGDWRAACEEASRLEAQRYADANARTSAIRAFFEFHFRPVRIISRLSPKPDGPAAGDADRLTPLGRFTGYFEPFYEATSERTPEFSAPVYARPDDLVTVDLGLFRPELAGQRIAGRVIEGALDPYPDHASINAGALAGRARILAWMRPTDLFFLQIQGSGRLSLQGAELRIGYDGANGRPYTAIGRTLIAMGALTRKTVSMKTIRDWLDKARDADARAVRESNESFVFFRVLDSLPETDLGPLGAEGTQLTPGRSLAVDPLYVAYGTPVWVSIAGSPESGKEPVRRLLIAQDTGGAIKGPVRGDIFVGSGPMAGDVAGGFNEIGEMYMLLPVQLALKAPKAARQ